MACCRPDAVLRTSAGQRWHIDVGDYERALQLAGYALEHQFTLPDRYNRTLPTLLQDDFAGASLGGRLKDEPAARPISCSRCWP
jgi:hypothetical protein